MNTPTPPYTPGDPAWLTIPEAAAYIAAKTGKSANPATFRSHLRHHPKLRAGMTGGGHGRRVHIHTDTLDTYLADTPQGRWEPGADRPARAIPCPRCNAPTGEPCRTATGTPLADTSAHHDRRFPGVPKTRRKRTHST